VCIEGARAKDCCCLAGEEEAEGGFRLKKAAEVPSSPSGEEDLPDLPGNVEAALESTPPKSKPTAPDLNWFDPTDSAKVQLLAPLSSPI